MNNYEKIKNMDIEEMATYLELGGFNEHCDERPHCDYHCTCRECLKQFLQQEV